MKLGAIGVRVHSGWSVLVAVSGDASAPEIVDRRHIVIIDPSIAGAKQPYHFAETLAIEAAEKHISRCAEVSQRLALKAIDETLHELRGRGYKVAGCALLLASGRKLPSLPDILASHALIHTAEGEFFRKVVREAFEELHVPVTGARERDIEEQAQATPMMERLSMLGRSIGPPWTKDEKTATLAGLMLLGGNLR